MKKRALLLSFGISALLVGTINVNFTHTRQYKYGDYIKEEGAYFAQAIDDSVGLVKAQKFVVPTDNKYTTQKSRSLGINLIGDIESVWEEYTGKGTTIAIIDDGFDYNHPEYIRSDGTSAILSTSRYYYSNASGTSVNYKNYADDPTSIAEDWEDVEWASHGTATSTTAAAPMNGVGGVGVAPDADILALKIDFTFASIDAAMKYAIAQGVDVINMSLGAYAESFTDGFGDSQVGSSAVANYLQTAAQQAYNAGVIVVAAAGNEATYRKSYPASNYKVVGVGAIGDYDAKGDANQLAEFTNYVGSSQTGEVNVDILAPGYVYTAHQMGTKSNPTHVYDDTQGTSFSSPIIAGAAALWKEKFPNGSPDQFLNELQNTADGKGTYTNKMVPVSKWDSRRSDVGPSNITNGRLNVAKLLDVDNPSVTPNQTSFNITQGEKRQITLASSSGVITYSSSNTNIVTVTSTGLIEGITAGTANITITATKNGKVATAVIPVTVYPIVAVDTLTFNPSTITLKVGETYNAEEIINVTPSNATRMFLFASDDESVARVDDETGLITAVGTGTALIEVISIYGEGYDTLVVTVTESAKEGLIQFGNSSGRLNVNGTNVTGTDNLGNNWTVSTSGTTSFTPSSTYAQIGSGTKPASTIEFKMTLPNNATFSHVSASLGGFNNSGATVTIKVNNTVIGSGNVNGTNDITVSNNKTGVGTTLSITLKDIARGIKAYAIEYAYTLGGTITPPTLINVSATSTKTYHPGEIITKSDIVTTLLYSDGTSETTNDFTFAAEGYRFTYEDSLSGSTAKEKQFVITYKGNSYSFNVNVVRSAYANPSGSSKTIGSSDFSSSNLSKSSGTASPSTVTIGGVAYSVSTNAYAFLTGGNYYLSFGKNAGSIQNSAAFSADLTSVTVNLKSDSRKDGILQISKNGSTWVSYSLTEIQKGGYRYFKYGYTNTNASYSNIASISYTLSGHDNALNIANYIMFEDTINQCLEKLDVVIEKLNTMSVEEKSTFWTSTDYVINTARERLLAWARHEGKVLVYQDDVFQSYAVNSERHKLGDNQTTTTLFALTLITLLGVTTLLGYNYIRRRKEEVK